MNAVYDYVKLADELVREDYERTYQEQQNPAPSYRQLPDELVEILERVLEDDKIPLRDFYESNDEDSLFSMPQDISESRFGIGLLLEKERYNFNLKQLFQSNDTFPLIGTWLGIDNEIGLSEIYKECQVELITLYVCRIFFNNDLIIQSSEIENLNPNRWDIWNNKYSSNDWFRSLEKLNEKYTELTDLLDKNNPNNIINWEQGSEFERAYSRIMGSGGGDTSSRAFSYIPLWILLNNIQSINSNSQSPKFNMRQLATQLTQKFKIDFEYLMSSRGSPNPIINKILSSRDVDEGDLIFPSVPLLVAEKLGRGRRGDDTTLETIDWLRNNKVEVKAIQLYSLEGVMSLMDNLKWLDAEKLGRGRRGIDTAYLGVRRKYTILYDGELIRTWNTAEDTWSFGLTGQFSINPPDTPNKLYQSLEYKITGLISNYLVLKPINYSKGLYIKLPSQEE